MHAVSLLFSGKTTTFSGVCKGKRKIFFVHIVEKRTFTHSGVCVSGRIHLE